MSEKKYSFLMALFFLFCSFSNAQQAKFNDRTYTFEKVTGRSFYQIMNQFLVKRNEDTLALNKEIKQLSEKVTATQDLSMQGDWYFFKAFFCTLSRSRLYFQTRTNPERVSGFYCSKPRDISVSGQVENARSLYTLL